MKIDIIRHKFHLAFIITAFLLNLSGPSSLILSPRGAHVCNRFLQDSSSSTSWSGEQDSRIVNLRDSLMFGEDERSMSGWCCMQWLARLHVFLLHLTWDLWLVHLGTGSPVLPTYWRPQGQEMT